MEQRATDGAGEQTFNLDSRMGNSLQSMCHCDATMKLEIMPEPESMWSDCDTQLEAGTNSMDSISQLTVYMRSMLISKAPMTMLNGNTYMTHNKMDVHENFKHQEPFSFTLD